MLANSSGRINLMAARSKEVCGPGMGEKSLFVACSTFSLSIGRVLSTWVLTWVVPHF